MPTLEDVLRAPDAVDVAPAPTRTEIEAPTLDAVLTAPDAPPPPGPARAPAPAVSNFLGRAVNTLPGVPQLAGALEGALPQLLSQMASGGDNPASIVDAYYAKVNEQRARNAAREGQPGSSLGTAAGIGGQLAVAGVPRLIASLPQAARAAPAVLRAALANPGTTARGAGLGAAKLGGQGALVGGTLGALNSPAEPLRGSAEEVSRTLTDAIVPALLGGGVGTVLGGTLGGARAATAAEAPQAAARVGASTQLDELQAARDALPERVAAVRAENTTRTEAAKAATQTANRRLTQAAEAEARNPTRDKAIRLSGLKVLKGENANDLQRRANALYDEPVEGGSGSLLVEMGKLPPQERLARSRALRQETGATLGTIRRELSESGAGLEGKVLAERVAERLADVRGDAGRQAVAAVLKGIKKGTDKKTGQFTAQSLEDLADELQALRDARTTAQGRNLSTERYVYETAKRVVQEEQTALVRKLAPERAPEFEEALRKYGLYKDLERGSNNIAKAAPDNQIGQGVRFPKPAKPDKVTVEPELAPEPAEPQFPGGPDAELAAEDLVRSGGGLRQRLGEILAGGGAALLGGKLGGVAGPAGAYAGARVAGQAGRSAARQWLQAVRPPTATLRVREGANLAALDQYNDLFTVALRKGPQAVAALHAALRDTDPEYAAVFDTGQRRE